MSTRTVEDLHDYMNIHGNTRLGEFNLSDRLVNCVCELNEIDLKDRKEATFKYLLRHNMKKKAIDFFNNFYIVNDIGYLPNNRLTRILRSKRVMDIDEVVKIYNNSAKYISPFKLPITYDKENIFDGKLVTQVLCRQDGDQEYLKDLKLFFEKIELPKVTTDLSVPSYIHEITHALVETHKGNIQEYYNLEVLSIFNELLYAYLTNKDMYYILLGNRLNNVYYTFNNIFQYNNGEIKDEDYSEFDFHSDIKYLLSTLKAYELLYKYITNHEPTRSYLMHQARRTLGGRRTVEDFLSDVGLDNNNYMNAEHVKVLTKQ